MGQWGYRSFDGDSVHDILDEYRSAKDPHGDGFDQPVPKSKLKKLLNYLDNSGGQVDSADFLGVIVFLVQHGSDVPASYVKRAADIAWEFSRDKRYLRAWKNQTVRKKALLEEWQYMIHI